MPTTVYNLYTELEQKLRKTITQRFPELTFDNGVDIPTTFDLQPGAETVSVDEVSIFGTANLLGATSVDIPLVQVSVGKSNAPVVMAVAGYSVNFQNDRAYSFSGKTSMVSEKSVLAVRRIIEEKLHFFAAYGEPALGIRGFYNNAAITPISSSFNPDTATYEEYITFFTDLVLGIGLGSVNTLIPTDIIVSRALLRKMAAKRTVNQQTSALEAVQNALRAIDGYGNITLRIRPESDSAILTAKTVTGTVANRDRIVIYRKDPMSVARQKESSMAQLFPQKYVFADPKGAMNYPMFSCASATQIYETNAVTYIDIVKPA